jgi:DNA-binding LytR/AlgR family response regulator
MDLFGDLFATLLFLVLKNLRVRHNNYNYIYQFIKIKILMPIGFLRTHQSHLVNKLFIKSWIKEDGGMLLLHNGDKTPVSRPNKSTVQAALDGS